MILLSNLYKVLRVDDEFLTAALEQCRVFIIKRRGDLAGCRSDCVVPVRKWSPESVKTADAHNMRTV